MSIRYARSWLPALVAVAASGCTRHVDMAAAAPSEAHATVLYTGVRDVSRRYADYGVVDRSILDDAAKP